MGVIKKKKLEVSRKHPEGLQREDAAGTYCQPGGVWIPILGVWVGGDKAERTG